VQNRKVFVGWFPVPFALAPCFEKEMRRTFWMRPLGDGHRRRRQRRQFSTFRRLWDDFRTFRLPVGLGFACLAGIQVRRLYKERNLDIDGRNASLAEKKDNLLKLPEFQEVCDTFVSNSVKYGPPYRWMSQIWGRMAKTQIPFQWMREAIFGSWVRLYNCNRDEMRYPLREYSSLSDFFLRPLKDGVRTIDNAAGSVVSPVDGEILHVGSIEMCEGNERDTSRYRLEQIKGVEFAMEDFLGRNPDQFNHKEGRKLQIVVLYLAPGDYHHFHSPVDWEVTQRRHFSDRLLSVRPWLVKKFPDLYTRNERVILNGRWEGGFFSLGAVGALNVGSIKIAFEEDLKTNVGSTIPYARPSIEFSERNYAVTVDCVKAQPLGSFCLGSTIVLVFESSKDFKSAVKPGEKIRVGDRIGTEKPKVPPQPFTNSPPWPGEARNILLRSQLRKQSREI